MTYLFRSFFSGLFKNIFTSDLEIECKSHQFCAELKFLGLSSEQICILVTSLQ